MNKNLKLVKHFSFDLWFTLIKSNPNFKKERAFYFYKNFNSLNKTIEEVRYIFRQTDLMCNAINEKTGGNIDAEEIYLMVIHQLNYPEHILGKIDIQALYLEMEQLIFKYMPVVFNEQTHVVLDQIKQQPDTTINLLSNTGFIKGTTLAVILEHLDLAKYFDFQIYSDEVGLSKPNIKIFDLLLEQIYTLRGKSNIALDEIIHVGDNPVADIAGAKLAGINAFHLNTNNKLITNLLD